MRHLLTVCCKGWRSTCKRCHFQLTPLPHRAGKAGLDHFTRCLALDEALHSNPAKVVSLAPGVIDTDMQTDLRSAKGASFPDQNMFVQLKNNGALTSPDEAARQLLAYLQRADFGSNPVADVRDN